MKNIFRYLFLIFPIVSGYLERIPHVPKFFFPFKGDELTCVNNKFNLIPINIDDINHFIELKEKAIGKSIVLKVSSLLPHFDGIGHKVLHANNDFISWMLNSHHYINDELKKDIILLSIKFAQHGDNFGSTLLQLYYDIVDKSL